MCWSGRWCPWHCCLVFTLVMRCLAGDQAREAPFPHAVLNTTTLAEEARDMFVQAYSNYTTHAFPMVWGRGGHRAACRG